MDYQQLQRQTDIAIERLIANRESVIVKEYAKSLQEIRLEVATAYEKYGPSYAEMAKYQRLQGLENRIFEEIDRNTRATANQLRGSVSQVYQEQYYRTAFNTETATQAKLSFTQLNPNSIKRAIANELDQYGTGAKKDTLGYLARHSTNQTRMKEQIRSTITQSLIQGEAYETVAAKLKRRLDIGASNAMRIARTEMHRVEVQGRRDSLDHAKNVGVAMIYQWIATLDKRTRDRHQEYDGIKSDQDGMFDLPGIGKVEGPGLTGLADEDINCRCTIVGIIEGYEPEFRRTREDGIIEYKNYKEYAKDKGWNTYYDGPEPRVPR